MCEKRIIISNTDDVKEIYDDSNKKIRYSFNNKYLDLLGDENQNNQDKAIKKINEIVNKFASQYENTIILTGAGSSILKDKELENVGIQPENISKYSGKLMSELREYIDEKLSSEDFFSLTELAIKVKYEYNEELDLEELLSRVDVAQEFIVQEEKEKFQKSIEAIEKCIKEICSISLCKAHPHGLFLEKITSRRKSFNRVKIFTTNYDTLFEEAAEENGFILIDGFSYTRKRKFSSKYFDYDFIERTENKIPDEPKYINKVVHLLKMHGSIDWYLDPKDNKIYKNLNVDNTTNPLMIYPRRAKFEQTYEKPYFELFSRFQQELKKPNTLLIVIGFSFSDKHIKSIVEEAIINNSGLKVLIVSPNIEKDSYNFFIKRAEKYEDTMLFSATFQEFTDIYKKQKAYSDSLFEGGEIKSD